MSENKVTIVSPVYLGQAHRINYFETYINSCLNQKDFSKMNFIFLVEPDIIDVESINRLKKYNNMRVLINPYKYGLLLNQYMTLHYSFEILGLRNVIYTEDDCLLSNDIYDVANTFINSHHYHDNIFTLLNKDNLVNPPTSDEGKDILEVKDHYHKDVDDKYEKESKMLYFATWGYMCTERIWRDCMKWWPRRWCFSEHIVPWMLKTFPKIVTPKLSRLNHIGVKGASYDEDIFQEHGFTNYMPKNFNEKLEYKFKDV